MILFSHELYRLVSLFLDRIEKEKRVCSRESCGCDFYEKIVNLLHLKALVIYFLLDN